VGFLAVPKRCAAANGTPRPPPAEETQTSLRRPPRVNGLGDMVALAAAPRSPTSNFAAASMRASERSTLRPIASTERYAGFTAHGARYEWDMACDEGHWRHAHNYVHHTFTNVVGKDRNVGYGWMRVAEQQPWSPAHLLQPPGAVALMLTSFRICPRAATRKSRPRSRRPPKIWCRVHDGHVWRAALVGCTQDPPPVAATSRHR
jgi:hypothetical protein